MGTDDEMARIKKKEATKCQSCGKRPTDEIETKVIKETEQCLKCIEKKEKVEGTKARICEKCLNITQPLNTFLDSTRTKWLCNECSRKEEYISKGIIEPELSELIG